MKARALVDGVGVDIYAGDYYCVVLYAVCTMRDPSVVF